MSSDNKVQWFKGGGWDKYDCHTPKEHWIHDDYYVSMHQREFHSAYTYMYPDGPGPGRGVGVQKKLYKVSSHGICVNGHYIGKSDNE